MIRQIVREEVAMAINEVVTELKHPPISSKQVVVNKSSQPKSRKKVVEAKQFSKNSILNEVMNDTAQSEEWQTLGGGVQTTDKMSSVLTKSYGDMMSGTNNNPAELANSMGFAADKAPDFLTKDYSKLINKIEKKNG